MKFNKGLIMKFLKFTLIQLILIGGILYFGSDMYKTIGLNYTQTIDSVIKTFLLTIIYSIFGIYAFNSKFILVNNEKTIMEKCDTIKKLLFIFH